MPNPHDTQEPQTLVATKETKHGTIIVDFCDADLLVKCVASETHTGYAYARTCGRKDGKRVFPYIHRSIMARVMGRDLIRAENIDHINKNTLDCRRSNLRIATPSQNHGNRKIQSNNKSGFKGVGWYKPTKKWRATIKRDGKAHSLGYFDDPSKAHDAYMTAARELFGEFANDGNGGK